MKLLLIAALTLLALADTDITHKQVSTWSQQKIDKVTGKNPDFDGEIIIWLFYSPKCCSSPNERLNSEVKEQVESKILNTDQGKTFDFEEVDVTDMDAKALIKYLQVDADQANFGPIVGITCEGHASWRHKDDPVKKIADKIPEYLTYRETARKAKEQENQSTSL